MKHCRLCDREVERVNFAGFCEPCWHEPFEITTVCRADLQDFLSPEAIARVDMNWLAGRLADAYCDQVFWIDLEIFAKESTQDSVPR